MTKSDKKIDMILKDSEKTLQDEMEVYSYDDDEYDRRKAKQQARKKKEKKRTRIKIAVLVAEVVVILGLSFALTMLLVPNSKAWLMSTPFGKFMVKSMMSEESYGKIVDNDYDRNNTGVNKDLDTSKLDEYLNIALFGLDARYGELKSGTNSDCIIIVSINKETKDVRMASIYRDTYIRAYGKEGNTRFAKINWSYANGGGAAAVKTLNANFDLNIQDYVAINFDGITELVDLLGGIDVTITEEEAFYINGYINSYFEEIGEYDKMYTHNIQEVAGNHHLDGVQTTAYCRIRYVPFYPGDGTSLNNDFGRAARQRHVINQMVSKAKAMGLEEVLSLAEQVFEDENEVFLTSIPYDDIVDLIPIVLEFEMAETEGFPGSYQSYKKDTTFGDSLLPDNLAQTAIDLHRYLFDDYDYVPSNSLLGINEALCSLAGLDTDYDLSIDEEESTDSNNTKNNSTK